MTFSFRKQLLPVKNACVKQILPNGEERLGRVMNTAANNEAVLVSVKWQGSNNIASVELQHLSCGFKIGMEVQDIPHSRVRKSLGEGIVVKTRCIGEREQVLVDFPELGKQVWLPYENLKQIKGVRHRFILGQQTVTDTAEQFRLKTLAFALELWNENTGALSNMEIDPLPHQIHLVHHILASGNLNWMIADDVGLGKTIETGMLLSALKQRGTLKRVLLITPAGLTKQWQEELNNKFKMGEYQIFGEDFNINEPRHWKLHDYVIASIDRLKDEKQLEKLEYAGNWDMVIFDEAHRLSRRQYGLKMDYSQRFHLAAKLRKYTDALILLTATPHQGMHDKFQALLELLHPERKSEIDILALNPGIIGEMIFRNNKADVTDVEGNFIFQGKTTIAMPFHLSSEAHEFDKKLQAYFKKGYMAGANKGNQGRAIGFVMTTYRKLAASSISAIYNALKNRKTRLEGEYAEAMKSGSSQEMDVRFMGEWEEEQSMSAQEFFDGELELLIDLIADAETIHAEDKKLNTFMDELLPSIHSKNAKEKVLIFTEYRTTQRYLKEALAKKYGEQSVRLINGSMTHVQRKQAIEDFENEGLFLISTEAGGEGINLQRKCHIMANYDLPWNPMRLVQRIGRLYRYGQKKPVVVFNLHSPDTADEKVIQLMYTRINQVVQDMADVSQEYNDRLQDDIVGEFVEMLDIETVLEEASVSGIERTRERIEEALRKAQTATEKQRELFDHAATFDPSELQQELNITITHLQAFAEGMFKQTGIEIIDKTHNEKIWQIRLPEQIQSDLHNNKSRYEVTFDRLLAASRKETHMLDLDSPIMKYLLSKAKSYEFGGLTASIKAKEFATGALIGGLLRWQNDQGNRMRQEYAVYHITEQGKIALNPDQLSEWLIKPAQEAELTSEKNLNKQCFARAEQSAHMRLANMSNQYLQPENIQWTSGAWVK